MSDLGTEFEKCRRRLFGLAYRMTGRASDAEDIVQETWLRASEADFAEIRSPEAYLMKIATRLCLDHLRAVKRNREVYVGPWLPEPIPDTEGLTPDGAAEFADDLSFALLMTLEKLSPPERAAFLLHDVFETPFPAVAEAIGRSEEDCRQLAARARQAVKHDRPKRAVAPGAHSRLLAAFADALTRGDPDRLKSILAADAVAYTDGGGATSAALNPIEGAERVTRFFIGLEKKSMQFGWRVALETAAVNGAPGLLLSVGGVLDQAMTIATDGTRIRAIYIVRNPAKLRAMRTAAR